jgi:hypothetical protein
MESGMMTLSEQANALSAWVADLTAPSLRLFTNPLTPVPGTTYAMLVEPVGTWYAAVAAVFGTVYLDAAGLLRVAVPSHQYDYSGVSPAETIYGWALVDVRAGPVTVLLSAAKLLVPKTMAGVLDALIVEPTFAWPPVTQSIAPDL